MGTFRFLKVASIFTLLFFAGSANALSLVGEITKKDDENLMTFNLTLGAGEVSYTIKGNANIKRGSGWGMGFGWDTISYSGVQVTKVLNRNGLTTLKNFPTSASVDICVRDRDLSENSKVCNIPVSGSFNYGLADEGFWFEDLKIADVLSKGSIDYFSLNGHYNAKDCSFGDCPIKTCEDSGSCVMDYDEYNKNDATEFKMRFSDLKITGSINFADITKTVRDSSSKSGKNKEKITGSKGTVSLQLVKSLLEKSSDGKEVYKDSEPVLSMTDQDSADDVTIRKFLVFLQLLSYDLLSQ